MAMAKRPITSAGTKLYVTDEYPATIDAAGFEALLNFTVVSYSTNMGEFGRTYEEVTINPLDTRQTIVRKGNFDEQSLPLEAAFVDDAGHDLLKTARDSDDSYSFKVEHQDGFIQFFTGMVMSYTTNVGTSSNMRMSNINIRIDSEIIEVKPV